MRLSFSWLVLLAVPVVSVVGAATLDGCTTQNDLADGGDASGDAPSAVGDASSDAVVEASAEAGGCTGDTCACAMASPALDRVCDRANPCPAELDCLYDEGCTNPKGKCRAWGRCPDSGLAFPPICGCDGVERQTRTEPFPVDPRNDTAGAPCPKDGGRD